MNDGLFRLVVVIIGIVACLSVFSIALGKAAGRETDRDMYYVCLCCINTLISLLANPRSPGPSGVVTVPAQVSPGAGLPPPSSKVM